MLLVEYTLLDNLQVINENTAGGATKLKLRGRFQKCDEQNNNGRTYPRKILEGQVKKIQEKIGDRSLVGALDHPANDAIHLSQASHLITGLSVDKSGDVIGECEILSTPNGKIVEALISDGVKIGISSRGVGSVSEGPAGKVVNEDFKLITFDLVSDPSTKGAFPELTESIRENSQRAQAIISKHKKERVLMTMLEAKVNKKLAESEAANKHSYHKTRGDLDRQVAHTRADVSQGVALDLADTAYKKRTQRHPRAPAADRDANKAVLDTMELDSEERLIGQSKPKPKPKATPKQGTLPLTNPKPKPKAAPKQGTLPFKTIKSSTEIIGNSLIEGFKKVCWGDRYDEGEAKKKNKESRREREVRLSKEAVARHNASGRAPLHPTKRMVQAKKRGGTEAAHVAATRQQRQALAHVATQRTKAARPLKYLTQTQVSNLSPKEARKRAELIRTGDIAAAKPKR